VKLIVDLIHEGGIANMRYSISNTREYGISPRPADHHRRDQGRDAQDPERDPDRRLRPGVHPRNQAGADAEGHAAADPAHPIEEVGARLRETMPWIKANKLVDRSRN